MNTSKPLQQIENRPELSALQKEILIQIHITMLFKMLKNAGELLDKIYELSKI